MHGCSNARADSVELTRHDESSQRSRLNEKIRGILLEKTGEGGKYGVARASLASTLPSLRLYPTVQFV